MSAKKIESADASSAEPEKKILSPDFKILETFVKVATLRSFRHAAKALKTTQPLVRRASSSSRNICASASSNAIVGWSH